MKLKDSFFELRDSETTGEETRFRIWLNASHPIYDMHFPDNPVTPGVCMIQIIKELAAELAGKPLSVAKVVRARYLRVIDPLADAAVSLSIQLQPQQEQAYKAQATFSDGEKPFSQFTLLLAYE